MGRWHGSVVLTVSSLTCSTKGSTGEAKVGSWKQRTWCLHAEANPRVQNECVGLNYGNGEGPLSRILGSRLPSIALGMPVLWSMSNGMLGPACSYTG